MKYKLHKTPPAAPWAGVMLSEKIFGVASHWYNRHTRPHTENNCEGCELGAPFKWYGYFFAYNPKEQYTYIFQITPGPYPAFKAYLDEHHTFRGAHFVCWREDKHSTAAVSARLRAPGQTPLALPVCPSINEPLDRIFFGGYKNKKFLESIGDGSPVQTSFVDEPPSGMDVLLSAREVLLNGNSNGKHREGR